MFSHHLIAMCLELKQFAKYGNGRRATNKKKSAKSSTYTFGLELSQINVANVIIYETRHKTEKP